jgi:hypothetical protein
MRGAFFTAPSIAGMAIVSRYIRPLVITRTMRGIFNMMSTFVRIDHHKRGNNDHD